MTSVDTPLYRDHIRPLGERVADLISQMSLEEKVTLRPALGAPTPLEAEIAR